MQREETDRMGQMERGHAAEVQPDCMTEAYTEGFQKHILRPMQRYSTYTR